MVKDKKLVLMRTTGLACFAVIYFFSVELHAQSPEAKFDYATADSSAVALRGHGLDELAELSGKLTRHLTTEHEKFRAIFTWVSLNIENDYKLFVQNRRNREKLKNDPEALMAWNEKMNERTISTLRASRRTVCTGYAYLIRTLARHAGIACEIIHGYGRTVQSNIGGPGIPNHSWNAVRIDGTWQLCDATWASGAFDRENGRFVKRYEPGYFLSAPELFVRNHFPLDTAWILMHDKPDLNEFLNGPIVYATAFSLDVHPESPPSMHIKIVRNEIVTIAFNGPPGIEDGLALFIGNVKSKSRPVCMSEANGRNRCTIAYKFPQKGKYGMHLTTSAGIPVVSYDVTVE